MKCVRELGRGTWRRTPESSMNFGIALQTRPASDTLFLETDNGDNPGDRDR